MTRRNLLRGLLASAAGAAALLVPAKVNAPQRSSEGPSRAVRADAPTQTFGRITILEGRDVVFAQGSTLEREQQDLAKRIASETIRSLRLSANLDFSS